MKHTILVFLALVLAGCSQYSANRYKNDEPGAVYIADEQVQGIVDEEYDTLIAPKDNYSTFVPYERQIANTPPAPKKRAPRHKPASKPKATPGTGQLQ